MEGSYELYSQLTNTESFLFLLFLFIINFHCVFQVEFLGEEGTGLGPTLEFYALVAAEFQRTELGTWLCDDDFPDDESRQVWIIFTCGCSEKNKYFVVIKVALWYSHQLLKVLNPCIIGKPGSTAYYQGFLTLPMMTVLCWGFFLLLITMPNFNHIGRNFLCRGLLSIEFFLEDFS